jgi:hypothetical protein
MLDEGKTPGFDLQTMIGKFYQHPLISSLYQSTVASRVPPFHPTFRPGPLSPACSTSC